MIVMLFSRLKVICTYNSILDGENDVVYPYGQVYQRQVSPEDDIVNEFLKLRF